MPTHTDATPAVTVPTAPADAPTTAAETTALEATAMPVTQVAAATLTPGMPISADGTPLVARVNGQEITLPQFERALARLEAQGLSFVDEAAERDYALQTLIEQAIIDQQAARQGFALDDAAIDAELASYQQALGGGDAWQTWLRDNLYTEEEFRESLRESLLTNRLRDAVTANLTGNVPQVRARHILVATEAEARDVLNQLQNGGRFEELAARYSLDVTTQTRGGDLGWFTEEELIEPNLARLAFTLPINGIAGPIQTRLGYHILQTLERAERPIPTEKLPALAQIRFENWLDAMSAQAVIERYQ